MKNPAMSEKITLFADPYKQCLAHGCWVDGSVDVPGPLMLYPCRHVSDYKSLCPSWGPVEGCSCADWNARHPDQEPIVHLMRTPDPTDGKVY